jgi:hypothetical protein
MHRKYAGAGFAAVSVSLDDPADQAVMKRVRQFLEEKKAAFTNLVLDEQLEVWQKNLRFDGPPSVFVFDRQGKWTQYTANDLDYARVEKLVVELLKKK